MNKPELQYVNLSHLEFDPENPRLPDRLKGQPDSEILRFFVLECNLVELMMSIGEKDYFAGEPLMAAPLGGDGRLVIVEGNRRLGALKLLQDTTPIPVQENLIQQVRNTAKFKPDVIPVLIFEKREDILSYLGYRHITGIKEWDSLAKARYLAQLRKLHDEHDHDAAHKALAKEIGSKSTTVAKLLTGLKLLQRAEDLGILDRLKITPDDIPFSLLTTGIGWEGIQEFIGLNGITDVSANDLNSEHFEEFFTWVFDKRHGPTALGESRNFAMLARVVRSSPALTMLRRGEPLERADLLTSGPLEAVRTNLMAADKSLQTVQETLAIVEGLTPSDVEHAQRVQKAASFLVSSMRTLLTEGNDADF